MKKDNITGIAYILEGVPHTKLREFKKYFKERISQNIKRLETETDIELYRAQGASRELNKIVLDLESIVKN